MRPKLRLIDLFSGAGGMTEGFRQTGAFVVKQSVELDHAASATYAQNHGDQHLFVGAIEAWLEHGDVPAADVVIGGPPCQGFSALGKQDVQDSRNSLWEQYAFSILRANPAYFILENVALFLDSPQYDTLKSWTEPGALLENYAVQAFILNAADYGAFQSRKRAIVVGRHRDLPAVDVPPPSHVGAWRSVREAFAGIEPAVATVSLPQRTHVFREVSIAGSYRSDELHVGRDYRELSLRRFESIPEGGNRFDLPDPLKAPCWIRHTSGSGDVMGRLHWDRPAVTIRTEFFKPEKGRYLHPVENRAITHFEAATLQGFSASYRWAGSKTAIARQIGNAVPVQLSNAIGTFVANLPR